MIVSVVLALTLSLGSTLAYLQDSDSDVNVMTLGNVYIEQHEYERELNADGTYKTEEFIAGETSYVLKEFTQGKPLYPAIIPNGGTVGGVTWDYDDTRVRMTQVDSYGTAQVFNTPNAVDKFVTVENTGKSDAYVRTLIALEVGTAELADDNYPNQDLIMTEIRATTKEKNEAEPGKFPWTFGFEGYIEVDGNKYLLLEMIYTGAKLSDGTWRHANGVLPAGDTTYPNLCQVYMASRATNEDVEAIDGNKNGTYDILVVSQAVQVAGFEDPKTALDTAFGEVSATSHPWLADDAEGDQDPDDIKKPITVYNVEELQAAIDAAVDGDIIVLGDDIVGYVTVEQKANTKFTISGANHNFDGAITIDGKSKTYTTAGLTIENVNFKSEGITEDAVIRLGDSDNDDKTVTSNTRYVCNVTVKNCTFDVVGAVGVKSYTGGSKNLVISDCEITERGYNFVNVAGIDNVLIENSKSYCKNGINLNSSVNVTIRNCAIDAHTGYAVRFGEGGLDSAAETYLIENSSLKARCTEEDDAVIVFRGSANNATLTLDKVTLEGTREYYYKNNPIVNIIVK